MREDWIECTLGEVCFTTSGGTPSRQNKDFYNGNIPWVKSGELDKGIIYDSEEHISEEAIKKSSAKIFPKGTLLFALYGATIGKMATLGVDAATNQAICGIYKNDVFNSEYLYNFLFSQKNFLIQQGIGGAQPNISQTILKKLNISIAPLVEQKAIVNKIEELFGSLDSGIVDLKKAQDQLVIYRQAVLKKAFEGELTKEWREKQTNLPSANDLLEQIKEERQKHYEQQLTDWKEAVKVWSKSDNTTSRPSKPKKNTNIDAKFDINTEHLKYIGDIPSSWTKVHIAFITANEPNSIVDGPFGASINVAEDYIEKGVPVIRINNILPYQYSKTKLKYIREGKFAQLRRHNIISGDVLLGKVGTIGNSCIYPHNEPEGMLSTTGSSRIRVDDKIITNKFFSILLNSKKQVLNTIASAAVQAFLNMTTIKNFPIPFMSIEEQHQIVLEIESRLSVCDKVEESIKDSLQKAIALRQSILKKAFEGKLLNAEEIKKCKQHKDYEPASVLLERIKKEKLKKINYV
ncbi:MAG: type I restriction enzyme S subunit [Flavobacteriaceae bacterium]|jgi:type I restriction enzyme S subunit